MARRFTRRAMLRGAGGAAITLPALEIMFDRHGISYAQSAAIPKRYIVCFGGTSLGGDGGRQMLTLESVNRRGKPIQCEVTCSPLRGPNGDVRGAIVLMEESSDGKH